MRLTSLALGATLALAAALPAQYGFLAHTTGSATQLQSGCGFNCSDPNNVVALTVVGGDRLNYEIQGDPGMLAGVLISIVPSTSCPGSTFPGVANSLLLVPAPQFTFVANLVLSLPASTVAGSCGAFGRRRVLALFVLPAALQGMTLGFQGFVHDNGTPTFTRPLEITIT